MAYLAEIGFIVLAIVAIVLFARSGKNSARIEEIGNERIKAYMTTLKRTGGNPELAAMTDDELRDILAAAMRRLATGQSRKLLLLVLGAIATLLAGIVFGIEEGWRAFAATIAVGGIALYGLERVMDRMTRAPIEAQGLDVERLRLD
jgi:hypothetical protein